MKYSFMTFSCPELTFDEVLALAKQVGYDGIEPRLDAKHAHGVEVAADADTRRAVRQKAADSGVAIACLATSCTYADPRDHQQKIDDTLGRIDLAADVGAPAIRVFGGKLGQGLDRLAAIDLVAESLGACADHARRRNVIICMETHDAWCDPQHVAAVMKQVNHPNVGVNWDVMHPVRAAGATMDSAFTALEPWIRHLHVHDGVADGHGLAPIGTGGFDHKRVIELLLTIPFEGYLSGEWINWHDPYERHLPRELRTLRRYEHDAGQA